MPHSVNKICETYRPEKILQQVYRMETTKNFVCTPPANDLRPFQTKPTSSNVVALCWTKILSNLNLNKHNPTWCLIEANNMLRPTMLDMLDKYVGFV